MSITNQFKAAIIGDVSKILAEDVGNGDVTTEIVDESAMAKAIIVAREPMTMAGQPWVNEVFAQLDSRVVVEWTFNDGDHVHADAELCMIRGPARAILTGERSALNFVQFLSATATLTSRYVKAIEGTSAQILDTRKTIPGLRHAQKYAVRVGGGSNHRIGLYDAILIKENHVFSAEGIETAVQTARKRHPELPVEIEVETIGEMREALAAGADRVLLDNFDIEDLQRAVEINQRTCQPPADLEASGGITLDNIFKIAENRRRLHLYRRIDQAHQCHRPIDAFWLRVGTPRRTYRTAIACNSQRCKASISSGCCFDHRRSLREVVRRCFVGHRELQDFLILSHAADTLHTHRTSMIVESGGHVDDRVAGQSATNDHFHPAMVGIHFVSGYGLRPVDRLIEREHLRRG